MCGFILTNYDINLDKQKKILNHRGPDDSGLYSDKNIKIIFNRLSIIDLNSRSNQPFIYKDYILAFNGEIYNYIELRNILKKKFKFTTTSDTEVLLYSFIMWGKDCLNKFEGMFSFCIYNKKENSIFAARDRFGIKPIFFYKKNSKFIISSEKKAIFNIGVKKNLNQETLSRYLNNGVYQNNDNTFYKDIFSLNPGNFIEIKNNKFNIKKWFNLKTQKLKKIKFLEAKEGLTELIGRSINYCLRSDKKISIALSGGLDSSTIVSKILEKKLKKKIIKLSHWTCGDENDEQKYASKLSKSFNRKLSINLFMKNDFNNYLDKCLDSIEEPFGGLAVMCSRKMYENLNKNKIRVLIDGNGADEILGGYQHHIYAFNKNYLDYSYQPVQGLKINFPQNILKKQYREFEKFKIQKKFDDPLKDSMYNDLVGSKLRRSLLQQDHNSMSQSIEVRFPFLNNDLLNFCYSLPNEFLINNNFGKYILRDLSNNKIFFEAKRPNQTPQTSWLRKFIIPRLLDNLKKDNEFFDIGVFDKKNLINELNFWVNNNVNNSVFPWYFLMSYKFIKKNFMK